ncbi:hypothetical protein JOD03_002085 [Chryseomicrobium aureum]|uniref:hypothetical protein n=1 Tax=Chryseomicrobium aureum TaxID=1441723 RepID=UPI00195C126D|nr:hypothetical protein [Chryseomicrobium aureum]MBM7707146.1 hypothetical protein [Chryseomicrobium aureum]
MKKIVIVIGMLMVSIGLFGLYERLAHPPLPFSSLTPPEVAQRISASNAPLVYLTEEANSLWYAVKEKRTDLANQRIEEFMASHGWELRELDGSGLFFTNSGAEIVLTTQKWTKNYTLVQVPKG